MIPKLLQTVLAAALLLLPACFLPQWDDRGWVDDDDNGDDDATGDDDDDNGDDDATDDDDATPTELTFQGTADLVLNIYGYPANCDMPLEAELDTTDGELDGDGECLVWGYVVVAMELSCDVDGTTAGGMALVYDNEGYIDTSLNISLDGSYDAANGTIVMSGSGSLGGGLYGQTTVTLNEI